MGCIKESHAKWSTVSRVEEYSSGPDTHGSSDGIIGLAPGVIWILSWTSFYPHSKLTCLVPRCTFHVKLYALNGFHFWSYAKPAPCPTPLLTGNITTVFQVLLSLQFLFSALKLLEKDFTTLVMPLFIDVSAFLKADDYCPTGESFNAFSLII